MAAPRLLPPDQELKKLVDQGFTHQQIADHLSLTTGHRVARATVSAALSRAGLTSRVGPRYSDELPWRVKRHHLAEYPARMLRLLGRRRASQVMAVEDAKRLDRWLDSLQEQGLVVAYCPEHTPGFLYVVADEVGDGDRGVPIRRRTITLDELA